MTAVRLPPGPRRGGQLRVYRTLRRDQPAALTKLARECGDVAYVRLGPERVYFFSHPDAVREIFVTKGRSFKKGRGLEYAKVFLGEGLLTSEGEPHRRQRRLAQPAFHRDRIATYATSMVEESQRRRESWRDGARVDMAAEMSDLTLAVVSKTLFSSDVAADANSIATSLTTVLGFFDVMLSPLAPLLIRLPTPTNRRMRAAIAELDRVVYGFIADHRASGDTGDLLSMLLLAQDEEAAAGEPTQMTDKQLRDEAMTILLAGHETTANALAWSWYLLGENPDAAKALHAELDTVLGGRPPTYTDLPALVVTERVLSESMRLFPPAWLIGRRATEDVEIGGWTVPAGGLVLASQWVVHRDPRWWPEPETFDLDRWLPEVAETRPRLAYFPFGGGGRVCIGEGFAWMEGVLLLATLAQEWAPELKPGHVVETHPSITLRPRGGLPMTLRRRAT